jgi:hypothetical protein
MFKREVNTGFAVAGFENFPVFASEKLGSCAPTLGVVLNQQNGWHGGGANSSQRLAVQTSVLNGREAQSRNASRVPKNFIRSSECQSTDIIQPKQ